MIRFPLTRGRGATTSQRPRRQGLNPVARLRRRRRLGARDSRLGAGFGGVLARERRGGNSLCCLSRDPLGPPLLGSRPRGINVGLRQTLEDRVKMGRHLLGVVAVVVVTP